MKRLYYILMALVSQAICVGVSAQQATAEPVYGEGAYYSARNYLLRATYKGGGEESYFLIQRDGYLYLLPESRLPNSPEELKKLLWKVTVHGGTDDLSGFSYGFRSFLSSFDLVFRSEEATSSGASASGTANRLVGDIRQWQPSSKSSIPGDNIFYHSTSGGKVIIAWGADGDRVVPRSFKDFKEAENARDVLTITPCRVGSYVVFSVNELNTNFGKNGAYDEETHDVRATANSYFHMALTYGQIPDVLKQPLQAQGVVEGDTEEAIVLPNDAYRTDDRTWFSLLVKDKGYIVATSGYTLETTDKWQGKTAFSADAYLFQVLYDGNTDQIYVRNKLNPNVNLAPLSVAYYVGGENQYSPATVEKGVYLIQVVGINDNRNSWSDETHPRKDKYLTFLPDGSFAFAEYGDHLRKDPAAQWVIEENTTAGKVTVTNRERGKYSAPYFGDSPDRIFKGSAAGTVFFLGTDTLRLVRLSSDCLNDHYAGYHHFTNLSRSNGFTLKYQGQGNLGVDGDGYAYITSGDVRFQLELVATETYGYTTPANTALVPLERTVYRLKYGNYYLSFDPDVAINRRYKLTGTPMNAAVFLLKEVRRSQSGEPQYQLFNAPYASGDWAEVNDVTGNLIALYTNGVITSGKTLVMAALSEGGSYAPIKYKTEAEVQQLGNFVTPIPVKGTSFFYAKYATPLSWLAVNSSTLFAVNVTDADYPRAEFAVIDHVLAAYRSFTAEDFDGEEQEIQIESILTSAALAPQSANSISLSYLAVEEQPQGSLVARYVRGINMPQYLLMSDVKESVVDGKTVRTARFLRSLADSVSLYYLGDKNPDAFLWEGKPRLAFVEGILSEDDSKLTIAGETIQIGYSPEEQQIEGVSSPILFSLRLTPESNGTFLLETRGDVYSYYGSGLNSWIKIVDGVPVLHTSTYEEAILEGAEVFIVKQSGLLKTAAVKETSVQVTAAKGQVVISGAAGKYVRIVDILGKTLADATIASEETVVNIPAGLAVVSVAGEKAVKVVVH
ncbi:MAG: DUF6383 domain-containing protein [Tannerellaceae bacterium]|nr:DUF6383 domain-containing protein [Tannerellaceae bacterium]